MEKFYLIFFFLIIFVIIYYLINIYDNFYTSSSVSDLTKIDKTNIDLFDKFIQINIYSDSKNCPILRSLKNNDRITSPYLNLQNKLHSLFYNIDTVIIPQKYIFKIQYTNKESEHLPDIHFNLESEEFKYIQFIGFYGIVGNYSLHDILLFIKICLNLKLKSFIPYNNIEVAINPNNLSVMDISDKHINYLVIKTCFEQGKQFTRCIDTNGEIHIIYFTNTIPKSLLQFKDIPEPNTNYIYDIEYKNLM